MTRLGQQGWLEGQGQQRAEWSSGAARPIVTPPVTAAKPARTWPAELGPVPPCKPAPARKPRPCPALDGAFAILQDTREPSVEHDAPEALFAPCLYRGTERIELPVVRAAMATGDYSIPGFEAWIAYERKSLPDLIGTCFGSGLDALGEAAPSLVRFRAELERGRQLDRFALVIEGSPQDLFPLARGRRWDADALIKLVHSFWDDYGIGVFWAVSRAGAEHFIGASLARVWEQSREGSPGARKARARGVAKHLPWMRREETGEVET